MVERFVNNAKLAQPKPEPTRGGQRNPTAVRPINKIMAKIIEIFAVNVLTSVCPGLARIRHQLHTSSGLLLVAGGKGVNCINGGSLWRCSPPTVASQTEGAEGWRAGGHRV